MEYIAILLGVLVIILLLLLFFMFVRPRSSRGFDVKELLMESERRQQEALFSMQKQIHSEWKEVQHSINKDISALNETTTQRLFSMEKNVSGNLMNGYEKTTRAFGQVLEQMGKLDESQKNLKELSLSISSIQGVLTDKKTRGMFGEIELYALLENAMGVNERNYAKQYKLSNGAIADAVIFAKDPLHMICIDSKFPLENYNRVMDAEQKEEQRRLRLTFVQDVKKHIKAIADKYIIHNETAEFAYLFLPAEAIFSYLHAACDEVIQYSFEQKVYIVSPTTLMAYITAIKAIYLGVERNENMVAIQKELKHLQQEFERFDKRYNAVGNDFEKCYQDMKLLSITARKLVVRFREIEAVELKTSSKDLEVNEENTSID